MRLPFGAGTMATLFLDSVAVEAVAALVAIPAPRRSRRGGVEALDDAIAAALQISGGIRGGNGDCGVDEHPHVDARCVQYGSEIVQIHARRARVDLSENRGSEKTDQSETVYKYIRRV